MKLLIFFSLLAIAVIYQFRLTKSENYHKFKRNNTQVVHTNGFFAASTILAPKAISAAKTLLGGLKGSSGGGSGAIGEIVRKQFEKQYNAATTQEQKQQIIALAKAKGVTLSVEMVADDNISKGGSASSGNGDNSRFAGIGTTWWQRNYKDVLKWGLITLIPLGGIVALIIYFVKKSKKRRR